MNTVKSAKCTDKVLRREVSYVKHDITYMSSNIIV